LITEDLHRTHGSVMRTIPRIRSCSPSSAARAPRRAHSLGLGLFALAAAVAGCEGSAVDLGTPEFNSAVDASASFGGHTTPTVGVRDASTKAPCSFEVFAPSGHAVTLECTVDGTCTCLDGVNRVTFNSACTALATIDSATVAQVCMETASLDAGSAPLFDAGAFDGGAAPVGSGEDSGVETTDAGLKENEGGVPGVTTCSLSEMITPAANGGRTMTCTEATGNCVCQDAGHVTATFTLDAPCSSGGTRLDAAWTNVCGF
jgi:hypothetical protein